MSLRSCEVAISARTFWMLQRIAAARRKGESTMAVPVTADKVAEEILSTHLAERFEKLGALFDNREKLNQEAEEMI